MNAPFEPLRPSFADSRALAQAIARIAPSDGDYETAIPGLTLHRRRAVTQPMHCIYGLGLGITAQGQKQVVLGEQVLRFGPGQSLLSAVDLPVVSTVVEGSHTEPFLGLMLHLAPQEILHLATELRLPSPTRDCGFCSLAVEPVTEGLLDAVLRLVQLLSDPVLLPYLAPLIQREIAYRLLTRAPWRAAAPPDQPGRAQPANRRRHQLAQAPLRRAAEHRATGRQLPHEPFDIPPALSHDHRLQPAAVPEATASAGSPPADAHAEPRCQRDRRAGRLRKRLAVQP